MRQIDSLYLAGPIEKEEEGGLDWRQELKRQLAKIGIEGRIPQDLNNEQELPPEEWRVLRAQDPDRFRKLFMEKIIKPDINTGVASSNAILVYWNNQPTSGTHAEATYGAMWGRPVFILLSEETVSSDISMWLFSCSTEVFHNTTELLAYLRGWNGCVSLERKRT